MRHHLTLLAVASAGAFVLAGCDGDGRDWFDRGGGGGGDGGGGPNGSPVSYVGTTGQFVAFANPVSMTFDSAPIGSYAGKRQVLRGTLDFTDGSELGQPAGVEIYKGRDGHIYELDLTSIGEPQPQRVSNETNATIDDTCSLSGTQVAGATYAYTGVYFAADLQNPVDSSYFYRLPGPGGTCNSGSDVIKMVKTGMSPSDAPVTVAGMPVATVHTSLGGIAGFVVTSGAQLVMVDANFQNPVVLGTFAAPISVAQVLPVGLVSGEPTGQLFVVDGNVVHVDYVGHSVSAPLYTIPTWSATGAGALFAASPTTLYIAQDTAATTGTAASTSVYAIPADGSATAAALDTEAGSIETLVFPVSGTSVLWGVSNGTYAIRAMPDGGGAVTTVASGTVNDGTFVATASAVYYTTWAGASDASTNVTTRSGTSSGIVGMDGAVIQAPLANSTFVDGGEAAPWPDDATTDRTPFVTLLQVQGLSTVTVTDPANGHAFTYDAVSGGTLVAIDAASNQQVATVGKLPSSNAVSLSGTFRDIDHNGFLEATNPLSTLDPATRDLYVMNTRQDHSLARVTDNL